MNYFKLTNDRVNSYNYSLINPRTAGDHDSRKGGSKGKQKLKKKNKNERMNI